MRLPGGNHLDRRRQLLPKDYLAPPDAFGVSSEGTTVVPSGGDEVSAEVARLQHHLVLAWRRAGCRPSGAAVARRFGFSRQTWSRTMLGERWMGETLMTALISSIRASSGRLDR
ncbi:MAG: hypothetical protein M0Z95_18025 [Actinomycetota bacterium]|nr:hypothetical protein [Actinomycetota bacterium]